jgi:hypothetical protein
MFVVEVREIVKLLELWCSRKKAMPQELIEKHHMQSQENWNEKMLTK